MHECTSIILAAGLSSRMGSRNKLLLPVKGVPMIRHVVDTYHAAFDGPVVVVVGHEAEAVRAALVGSAAETIYNPDYESGQPSSVACGLRNCAPSKLILLGLGDQPLLSARDLRDLVIRHSAVEPARISIPTNGDARGNPIVVPWAQRAPLLADPVNPGCQRYTRTHRQAVKRILLDSPGFYVDVDTPDAYSDLFPNAQDTHI